MRIIRLFLNIPKKHLLDFFEVLMQIGGANSRHEARIRALQVLYAVQIGEQDPLRAFEELFSMEFRLEDIKSWSRLITKIASGDQPGKNSPYNRIWEYLPEDLRPLVLSHKGKQKAGDELKREMVEFFNSLLEKRNFYSSSYWPEKILTPELQTILRRGVMAVSENHIPQLNRSLIEISFPNEVLKCHYQFTRRLVMLGHQHSKRMDELIKSKSRKWDLNRIALLDHLILRQALCEFFYIPDVPPKVTINEAIEVAKAFSTDQSGSFINGILDSVYLENEAEIRRNKDNQGNAVVKKNPKNSNKKTKTRNSTL